MPLSLRALLCAHTLPAVSFQWDYWGGVPPRMSLSENSLEIAGGLATIAVLGAAVLWLALRRRPTEDEIEQSRRSFLVQSGRLVDGMLLDICEMEGKDGRTLTLLIFNYRISGVDYECSQDITSIRSLVNEAEVRIGYPCNVRYQVGNPQNSIIIAESWSGLRATLPQMPSIEDPAHIDASHLKAGT
jgi:hypothetical protein